MGRLAAIVVLLALAPGALADDIEIDPDQATSKDPKLAKKWTDTAKQLVHKGDAATRAKKTDEAKVSYENAITAYEKAIETGGDVNLTFELAWVEEKAGKLDHAARHYRMLVKAEGARAELVKKAAARYDDLTMKTGLVTLITKPKVVTISIGGTEIAKTPLVDPIVMMPGTYTLTLAAEGHVAKDLELDVEAGSETERTLELDAVKVNEAPVQPVVVAPPLPEQAPTPAQPTKLPLYVGVAATGGFALAATITGLVAIRKHAAFENPNKSPSARQDAKDSGKTLAVVTDVCIVGALAAGGFTAYWYLRKYKPAQENRQVARRGAAAPSVETKTAVVPWVQPDAGGVAFAGSF